MLRLSCVAACVVILASSARAQAVTNCTSNGEQTQCASSSPAALTTYTTCSVATGQCAQSAVAPLPLLGVGLKQTNCVAAGSQTDCKTTSPTELTTYTSCHGAPGAIQCGPPSANAPPSLSLPSPEQRAEQEREHQVEIQNEARGAVAIGQGVAGLFHAMHAYNRRAKAERLAELNANFVSLEHDYDYGATLVTAAQARGDTAAVRRLSADQVEMSRQLTAIADSAAKVAR
jgi:hypothetical protein